MQQATQQFLIQNKIKELRFKAITSFICGVLGAVFYAAVLPSVLLGIASWVLFFLVLYDLKIYGGAKNLFKNYFTFVVIYLAGAIISLIVLFLYLDKFLNSIIRYYIFYRDSELLASLFQILGLVFFIFLIASALSYKFIKAFYDELARVSGQQYFNYAFWFFIIGICTCPFGIGFILLFINSILQLIAWINFKEFKEQEYILKEIENETTNSSAFYNLKSVKIFMIISLVLVLVSSFNFIFLQLAKFMSMRLEQIKIILVFPSFAVVFSIIFSFVAIILLCQKLKSYKILSFFALWQIVFILQYVYNGFIKHRLISVISKDIIANMSAADSIFYFSTIPNAIFSILLIISSFFFFRALVKRTNNELFFVVFASYALTKLIKFVEMIAFGLLRYKFNILESLNTQLYKSFDYISLYFTCFYAILAIVVWLRLRIRK